MTGARGLAARAGRYGGTYAHKDIAFEFGSWLSPEFKLYVIKEFQRLKEDENRRLSLDWNLNRTLSKLNYRIHTDAIKEHLIPAVITPEQARITYANEADVLNIAMFGQTAKAWRDAHPKAAGNMRDDASIEQLLVADIVFDFSDKPRLSNRRGNAILVASSIYEACKYYELFQGTPFKGKCAVVTSYNPQTQDITLEETGANSETDKQVIYNTYTALLQNVVALPDKSKTETYEDQAKKLFKE